MLKKNSLPPHPYKQIKNLEFFLNHFWDENLTEDFSFSRPRQDLPLYSKVQKTSPENFRFSGSKLSSLSLEQKFQDGRKMSLGTDPRKQNQLQLETKRSNQLQDLNKNLTQVPLSQPNLILRSQLKLLERLEFNLYFF